MATPPTHTLSLFPLQYRTFDRVYVITGEDAVSDPGFTIKVLTPSLEYLTEVFVSQRAMSSQSLGQEASSLLHRAITERTPTPLLRTLFEQNLLPKAPLADLAQSVLPQEPSSSPADAMEGCSGAAQAGRSDGIVEVPQRLGSNSDELTDKERQQAISATKDLLIQEPHNYGMYTSLVNLLAPERKAQKASILLKGSLHALERGEEEIASAFLADAKKLSPQGLSILDHQIGFQAKGLLQEDKKQELKTALETLQASYQTPPTSPSQIKTLHALHKLLSKLEKNPTQEQGLREAFPPSSLSAPSTTCAEARSLVGAAAATETIPPRTHPPLAFGAAEWNRYIGDVGVEPPLPPDIESILASPCPFFPGKTVGESHLLVLIPHTVNGRPFTLDSLNALSGAPKVGSGGHTTQYDDYQSRAKRQHGSIPAPASHWVLFTRDVIPGTRRSPFFAQYSLLKTKRGPLPYEVPNVLDAATAIVMHYVRTGEKLYRDNSDPDGWTFTRCTELVGAYNMACGGFGDGIRVDDCGSLFDYAPMGLGGARTLTEARAPAEERALPPTPEVETLETPPLAGAAAATETIPTRTRPPLAFGAAEWNRYIGDVGVEPPLPPDIESILLSPCPFFPGKTVGESHILVLIPHTVNGSPLTLDSLSEFSQHPKEDSGGHTSQYASYWDRAKRQHGSIPAPLSHWVLFTRDVIPGTKNKSFSDQCSLLDTKTGALPYEVPNVLDVTTAIVMHYMKTGETLYPGRSGPDGQTLTRCIEQTGRYRIACGGFDGGVCVINDLGHDADILGLGGARKF